MNLSHKIKTSINSISLLRVFNRTQDDKVIDHFNNPRNVGKMDTKQGNVGTGFVGSPACGDMIKLQVQIEDGVIQDAKFKTFGCGSAIACSSLATEKIKGKTVHEAAQLTNQDLSNELKLPPVKLHCSMLAEQAIKKAIGDQNKKQVAAE